MVQPLNIRTIKSAVVGARQYVQDEKIQISRRTITRFQYAERWPDEYNSFVTSETKRNLYKDHEKFFRVMHAKPELYARKFIFRPVDGAQGKLIRQATIDALSIVVRQSQKYGIESGFYSSSFKLAVDRAPIVTQSQLDDIDGGSTTQIYNIAPYAGTVEKNAVYFKGIEGVIYYAANQIKHKYPMLGVRFVYNRAASVPGSISKYDIPMLTIGSRDNVVDRIKKPGRQHRRRARLRRARQ